MNKRQYKKLVKVMRAIKPCRDKYRKNAIKILCRHGNLEALHYCYKIIALFGGDWFKGSECGLRNRSL